MNVKAELLTENSTHLRLNDVNIEPEKIRAIMITKLSRLIPAMTSMERLTPHTCRLQSHCSVKRV